MSALLLSERLPLRSTKALGDYSVDQVLPIILGDHSHSPFPLLRLDDKRYFVADHVMAEVSQVFADRQAVLDWAEVLESDDDGHTWSEIHFSTPIPQDVQISATGKGKFDTDTGELIENPANAMRCVSQLAGRSDDWSAFRAECSALDLTMAIRIADSPTVRTAYDRVTQSVGAIWTPGMARLYPSAAEPMPILDLEKSEVSDIQVSASLVDTADVLRLAYDRSDASDRCQHYIELSASPQRYGGLSREVEYPYLRTPANAEAVGRPVLQRMAGERYPVTFNSTRKSIRPGDWVRPVAHPEWPLPGDDPVIMVLTVEVEQDSDSVRVTGETIIGQSTVTVTAHSIALPDTVEAGIDVSVRDGVATFTITDSDGRPIHSARVSLDGAAPKSTNAQGKVSFPVTAGVHELAVEAPGFTPFTIQVAL